MTEKKLTTDEIENLDKALYETYQFKTGRKSEEEKNMMIHIKELYKLIEKITKDRPLRIQNPEVILENKSVEPVKVETKEVVKFVESPTTKKIIDTNTILYNALSVYANKENYRMSADGIIIIEDGGQIARQTLERIQKL